MRLRASLYLLALALPVHSLPAATLDLNLNDDAARLTVEAPLRGQLQADGSWMYHQDKGNVISAGVHLAGRAAGSDVKVDAGIGARLYYLDPDRLAADGAAIAIGGFVDYTFPRADRFGVRGYAYFAPDVLATGEVEQYYEVGAHLRYELLRDADIYLGLRILEGAFEGGADVTFDNGPHIGFRLSF